MDNVVSFLRNRKSIGKSGISGYRYVRTRRKYTAGINYIKPYQPHPYGGKMVNLFVRRTASAIRTMKIQGSSKVRKAVVQAMRHAAENSKARTVQAFRHELKENALLLLNARPTEPETRTALRVILKSASLPMPLKKLKRHVVRQCVKFEENRKQAMEAMAKFGASVLEDTSTVFTHCHSHTVEEIIKEAWKRGYIKEVIATETRPLYQGRITVRKLSKEGIPCKLIVDSAAATYMKYADVFLTGADAILADGSVVNKVGTALISLAAKHHNVPHYVASSSHCFDPATFYGKREPIEQRPVREVWQTRLRHVTIENPAFDITPARHVKAIIYEHGVLAPESFVSTMVRELGLDRGTFVSLLDMLK
jgi:ribose 1,5-bisphosphate isomerase